MVSVLQKVLGDPNAKAIKRLTPMAKGITELEPDFQKMTDEELQGMTAEFRTRLAEGESLTTSLLKPLQPSGRSPDGALNNATTTFSSLADWSCTRGRLQR